MPLNDGQRKAVEGLGPGLSIIHGPPGTGKSTTIFHIIEGRVQPKAQARAAGHRTGLHGVVGSKWRMQTGRWAGLQAGRTEGKQAALMAASKTQEAAP